ARTGARNVGDILVATRARSEGPHAKQGDRTEGDAAARKRGPIGDGDLTAAADALRTIPLPMLRQPQMSAAVDAAADPCFKLQWLATGGRSKGTAYYPLTSISSTSKISVASGGMTPPAPRLP